MANISDKLTTVAENVPKVYHAGQMNVVKSSTYLSGFEHGIGKVTINDISPIDHILTVAVSTGSDELLYDLGDTPIGVQTHMVYRYTVTLEKGNTYKFSINAAFQGTAQIILRHQSGGSSLMSSNLTNGYNQFYYTASTVVGYAEIMITKNTEGKSHQFTNFCIYKVKSSTGLSGININTLNSSGKIVGTYVSSADGMVDGVSSIYPVTQLKAEDETVIINCNYYKDIDKTIKNLQTNIALSGGE